MKKQNRILKNAEFSKIMQSGKKYNSKSLSFYFVRNQSKTFRIGITISKKVSKLAVARNLIKRRIAAVLTLYYPIDKLYDIVIVARPNSIQLNYNELEIQIKEFLQHI